MILDTLDSSFRYETLHPLFPSAFAFLRRPDLDALACGRIDLAGDDALYALIQTYETQPPAEGKPEARRVQGLMTEDPGAGRWTRGKGHRGGSFRERG